MNGCCSRFLGGRTESGLETSSDEASALATIEKIMDSPILRAIVGELDATEARTASTLSAALRRPVNIDDVAAWIRFDPGNYVRNLITRTDCWELRLLCCRPGQSSSLHGHGGAACAFRVLRGTATESVLGQRDRTWVPGDVIDESSEKACVASVSTRSCVASGRRSSVPRATIPSCRRCSLRASRDRIPPVSV
jgi:hypothetical protein